MLPTGTRWSSRRATSVSEAKSVFFREAQSSGCTDVEYCESKNQYPPYNQKSGAFAPCSGHGHQIPAKDISVGTVPAGST